MSRNALFRDIHNPTLAETLIVSNPVKAYAGQPTGPRMVHLVMVDEDPFDEVAMWVFGTEAEADAFAEYIETRQGWSAQRRDITLDRLDDVGESIAMLEGE